MADPESLVPRLAGAIDAQRMRAMPLAPTDGFILSRIDGATSVRELAETTGVAIEAVVASLMKLQALSLVVLPGLSAARKLEASREPASGAGVYRSPVPSRTAPAPAASAPSPPRSSPNVATASSGALDIDEHHQKEIAALFARLDETDHYALLGVDRAADKKAIKRAYFELTARYHPDRFFRKNLGPFKAQMESIFGRMSEAHETLTSDRRAEYDTYLGSLDRTRHIEQMVEEATAEIRRVEEAALSVTVSSAPPPPPSSSSQQPPLSNRFPGEPTTGSRGVPSAPASAPGVPSSSPGRSDPPDTQSRREMLARRLTGNAGRISSGSFRAPAAPKVPTIAFAKTDDAVDALKRRYDEKVSSTKSAQAKKYADTGMAARMKGDVIAAANALRVAVTFDPDNAELKIAYEEAQRESDRLLADQYAKQADYEEKAEKWAEAARSWQRVARAKTDDLRAHERAAQCLVRAEGNLHEAAALAQRAVQLAPKSAHPHVVLANVYLAAGLGRNARREAEAALAIAPEDQGALALLKRIGKLE